MVELAYLGQQSWLVDVNGVTVLVDPVLTDSFGHSDRLRFEIFPPRTVDLERLPHIDAVIVTNEHLDHFHLPSLLALPFEVPILVPELFPAVCVQALREHGRDVQYVGDGQSVELGDASVRFFDGAHDVPLWELGVSCVHIGPTRGRPGGVLIQSDTALPLEGPQLADARPDVLVATYNAQITPPGHLGAFDNLLPVAEESRHTIALEVLHEVLHQPLTHLPSIKWVVLSGGGYTQVPQKHGEFLWNDFSTLAETIGALTVDAALVGLRPGETFELEEDGSSRRGEVSWVTATESSIPVLKEDASAIREIDFSNSAMCPIFEEGLVEDDWALMAAEFQQMAPHLLLSKFGRSLTYVTDYLGHSPGAHRFCAHLRLPDGTSKVLALNFNAAQFDELDLGLRDALFSMPSGIDVHATDLVAVFTGRLHIWELAVSRMRQWYVGPPMESPVAFLYGYLGERTRPDLARRLYHSLLKL